MYTRYKWFLHIEEMSTFYSKWMENVIIKHKILNRKLFFPQQ